jgi:hypothetical protein
LHKNDRSQAKQMNKSTSKTNKLQTAKAWGPALRFGQKMAPSPNSEDTQSQKEGSINYTHILIPKKDRIDMFFKFFIPSHGYCPLLI